MGQVGWATEEGTANYRKRFEGQLARDLPPVIGEVFGDLQTDAQRSLQFVRSAPGVATALVGMKHLQHVEENLKVAQVPPAPWEQYEKLFKAS